MARLKVYAKLAITSSRYLRQGGHVFGSVCEQDDGQNSVSNF